jgi:DNA-binding response OmpR family regulator
MPVASGSDTIVVVEDDPSIAGLLELYLRRAGYVVHVAADGEGGLDVIRARRPAVVILDIGLPGMDGLEVCRRIRASDEAVAVIFLTARREEIDRILGLELGADDYVTKPFSPGEMVARVRARLRRQAGGATTSVAVVEVGNVVVDLGRREVKLDGGVVPLATREYELLRILCDNRGLALTRRQILDSAWGTGWVGDERTVDVHVAQLRSKLGNRFPLSTVWGIGYRLD